MMCNGGQLTNLLFSLNSWIALSTKNTKFNISNEYKWRHNSTLNEHNDY